jgi:predicted metallopeptidase
VQKCFCGLDHFYEMRADNGLIEYVRSWDKRTGLPHEQWVVRKIIQKVHTYKRTRFMELLEENFLQEDEHINAVKG